MFDLVTEEMIGCWGEDDENQGESKLQEKHVLNSDLQEIFHDEEECDGCSQKQGGVFEDDCQVKLKKKPTWGKLQNLDLIPNTYIYH